MLMGLSYRLDQQFMSAIDILLVDLYALMDELCVRSRQPFTQYQCFSGRDHFLVRLLD